MQSKSNEYIKTQPDKVLLFDYVEHGSLASTLKLSNTTNHSVLYKVKINVVSIYTVHPKMGYLQPNQTVHLTIKMTPSLYKSQSEVAKHKFLINVIPCNQELDDARVSNMKEMETLWNSIAACEPIQDIKLTVSVKLDIESFKSLCLVSEIPSAYTYVQTKPGSMISFNYSPDKVASTSLLLSNISDKLVVYKIRTNVIPSFVAKPCKGILQPGQETELALTLNPEYFEKSSNKAVKLLLNAIPYEGEIDDSQIADQNSFNKLWELLSSKPDMQASKIKVDINKVEVAKVNN